MKIVTFNIRYDNPSDGKYGYPYRKPFIRRTIAERKPEILCFQEVLPHVAEDLRASLTEYTVLGVGRDPKLRGEQATVAFRTDRFNLMEMRTFWLSDTPYVPGSRYPEQSDCPRVTTALLLEDRKTGDVFRVIDTHLDHIGVQARVLGLRRILRFVEECTLFPDAPVLLAGDFNAEPDGDELKVFDEFEGWRCLTPDMGITYHGFGEDEGESIDYIYAKGAWKCAGAEKWTMKDGDLYLSDHYPVCAEVSL